MLNLSPDVARHRRWGAAASIERARRGKYRWLTVVYAGKLRSIRTRLARLSLLHSERRHVRLATGDHLRRKGARRQATLSAVVTDMRVIDIANVIRIGVMDGVAIYMGHVGVVHEVAVIPVAALVACAVVAVAVIHSAVKTDVRSPIAVMEQIAAVVETPVAGRPESAGVGREHPRAGNPVIAGVCVIPIAGRPHVVGAGSFGLIVIGKRRRRIGGIGIVRRCFIRRRRVVVVAALVLGRRCGFLSRASLGGIHGGGQIRLFRRILAIVRSLGGGGVLVLRGIRRLVGLIGTVASCNAQREQPERQRAKRKIGVGFALAHCCPLRKSRTQN